MISNSVVISLYTMGVAIVTFPIMLAVLLKIKTKIKISPFLIAILVYFTFSLVCPTFVHSIFLNQNRPTSAFLQSNVFVYSLYNAIVIGLFDQLGMYVAFKKLMTTHEDKRTPIMYAFGHAGADVFIMCFFTVITYVLWAETLNAKGVDGFMELYTDAKYTDAENAIEFMKSLSVRYILLIALERVIIFIMHTAFSVIIFYSVKRDMKVYFWIAVILRGLCSIPGSLEKYDPVYSEGINQVFIFVFLIIFVAVAVFIALKLYRIYDSEDQIQPADLFKKVHKNL